MRKPNTLVWPTALVCLSLGVVNSTAQFIKPVVGNPVTKQPAPLQSTGPISLSCGTVGRVGESFVVATAKGGKAPYVFKATAPGGVDIRPAEDPGNGSLVADKSFSSALGDTVVFTVDVKDSAGKSAPQQSCKIDIIPATPGALFFSCPGDAIVNTAFMIASVSGGTKPYKYKTDTDLPPPLVLGRVHAMS